MNHSPTIPARVLGYDVVRLVAIIGVVATHAEVITASPTNYLGGLSWWLANTVHSLVSVSVPLFIMLTGALILTKPVVSYRYVLPKVMWQFVIPLLGWWFFYTGWAAYRTRTPWEVGELVQRFWHTDTGHLYYLQLCIGLYLLAPLLHRASKQLSVAQQRAALIAVSILAIGYEYASFWVFHTYNYTNALLIWVPFVSYLWWGYHLARHKVSKSLWWGCMAAIGGLTGVISVGSYFNTVLLTQGVTTGWTPQGGNLWWEPFTLPVMILSVLCWVVLTNLPVVWPTLSDSPLFKVAVQAGAGASFGIYLIHPLIIELIDHYFQFGVQFISYSLAIYYLLRVGIMFGVSWGLVLILLRVPYVRSIFGLRPVAYS